MGCKRCSTSKRESRPRSLGHSYSNSKGDRNRPLRRAWVRPPGKGQYSSRLVAGRNFGRIPPASPKNFQTRAFSPDGRICLASPRSPNPIAILERLGAPEALFPVARGAHASYWGFPGDSCTTCTERPQLPKSLPKLSWVYLTVCAVAKALPDAPSGLSYRTTVEQIPRKSKK